MGDVFSREVRSRIMAAITGKNTKPEVAVRSWLHSLGYRFRIHQTDLPGKPDIVLRRYRSIILVNGCFWHRHPRCKRATTPKSHDLYWKRKFKRNVQRDAEVRSRLKALGWKVFVVWECELQNRDRLVARLNKLLQVRVKLGKRL